ncbi:CLUMA_CG009840, isoform A [Clunio marinus]|uniref:CLUMA_CG009840, isoform A n=1 Tax=Clunio marinus TaxID=568069 RepID=A0A1J1I831_9DIPT|nr:CLUMA_CG009840, isoform A [Clunio marinus]
MRRIRAHAIVKHLESYISTFESKGKEAALNVHVKSFRREYSFLLVFVSFFWVITVLMNKIRGFHSFLKLEMSPQQEKLNYVSHTVSMKLQVFAFIKALFLVSQVMRVPN